jgi:hypothetical protein|tara:strand:- start:367 stop:669 length:303 start_codon:yes stop_codon:yes gene_type:complete
MMKKNKKEQLKKKGWTVGDMEDFLNDPPSVYICEVKDNPDDSCTITFDTNKAFDELYKKEKGRKRVSRKGLGDYVLELIQKGLAKEDGYDLKTLARIFKK